VEVHALFARNLFALLTHTVGGDVWIAGAQDVASPVQHHAEADIVGTDDVRAVDREKAFGVDSWAKQVRVHPGVLVVDSREVLRVRGARCRQQRQRHCQRTHAHEPSSNAECPAHQCLPMGTTWWNRSEMQLKSEHPEVRKHANIGKKSVSNELDGLAAETCSALSFRNRCDTKVDSTRARTRGKAH